MAPVNRLRIVWVWAEGRASGTGRRASRTGRQQRSSAPSTRIRHEERLAECALRHDAGHAVGPARGDLDAGQERVGRGAEEGAGVAREVGGRVAGGIGGIGDVAAWWRWR